MKLYCVFAWESPHSDEYTHYTIFNIKKENHPKVSQICSCWIYSNGLKNELDTAVVNEPSVPWPLSMPDNQFHSEPAVKQRNPLDRFPIPQNMILER